MSSYIGHLLGETKGLHQDDIQGIQALYNSNNSQTGG